MANQKHISVVLQLFLVALILNNANGKDLKLGFYQKTCPKAEAIVKTTTANFISRAPSLAPALLRMHFHDCFVRGCDGSVLINSTTNNKAEKDGPPNLSLRGFQVIDAVKTAVEAACPGVVSCADILALVARDSITQIKGPFWPVPLGRRDGRVSLFADSLTLPAPFMNFTQLKANFASRGLNEKDLVVLSGGHTVGVSHCSTITTRLYNFTGKGDTDPSLDSNYATQLKSKCKPADTTTFIEMDPGSSKIFDGDYYTLVSKRRGLFQSDAALLDDKKTRDYIKLQATSHGSTFIKDFQDSMVKMGKIGVLTGTNGEIRKKCTIIN
ncbi:peroxidase 27-like [Rutidosis leptorrhynchoides]|uniref:peroxidase 27-like n=1 Tax=Rutidosis leptorrhynchoides TaxID=125765 RepID=UPI003A99FC16